MAWRWPGVIARTTEAGGGATGPRGRAARGGAPRRAGPGRWQRVARAARRYRARGLRVAILSRGYGQSDGLNDEGRVLEENLPDVPHLQDRDRARLARVAVEELEAELLLLDDGFQHRRLARALDLALVDALEPFAQRPLFPPALLPHPIGPLRRAGLH